MSNTLNKLNDLNLIPHNPEEIDGKAEIISDSSLPESGSILSTVKHPNGMQLSAKPKLMCRYELLVSYKTASTTVDENGNEVKAALQTTMVPPGAVIPLFRKVNGKWQQMMQCCEMRTYTAPFFNAQMWVMGEDRPTYQNLDRLISQPGSNDMRLSKPGGLSRLRPHSKLPGMLPILNSGGTNPLRREPWQASDFIKVFGHMPLITLQNDSPFRFVKGDLTAEDQSPENSAMGAIFSQPDPDRTSASILTKSWLTGIEPLDLPISTAYATEILGDDFEYMRYESGVLDYLQDEEFVFIQHKVGPYLGTPAEETISYMESDRIHQPFTREDLPPAMFLLNFNTKKEGDYYDGITPMAYDMARKFKTGEYNPTST